VICINSAPEVHCFCDSFGYSQRVELRTPGMDGTAHAEKQYDLTNTTITTEIVRCAHTKLNAPELVGGRSVAPCRNGMVLRAVKTATAVVGYAEGVQYFRVTDATIATGKPGVGVRAAPEGNSIAQAQLGALDTSAPAAVPVGSVALSTLPNRVMVQWPGVSDNSGGTGVAYYCLTRTGGPTRCSRTLGGLTDSTVAADTTYEYRFVTYDYHLNSAQSAAMTVRTPPAGAVDPRRIGVRGTGAYWGGMGENIDVLSGNLNFTLPLLKAQGRGGWGVGFNLTYNSQTWRYDGGASWNLGQDVGYGYGWKLLAGALTPVWGDGSIHHYALTDATGAEYRLDQNSGGVWTSSETYVTYDPARKRLYFNDGSFWAMGCTSAGTEADAGTMYPTLMQDTNGNQIVVRYQAGAGVYWTDSSARIAEIEDVRATIHYDPYPAYRYRSYYFTYSAGRLASISNTIGTSEGYTFSYTAGTPLTSPFDGASFGTAVRLNAVADFKLHRRDAEDAEKSAENALKTVTCVGAGRCMRTPSWTIRDWWGDGRGRSASRVGPQGW
jgi:hypothetical protein